MLTDQPIEVTTDTEPCPYCGVKPGERHQPRCGLEGVYGTTRIGTLRVTDQQDFIDRR